MELDYTEDLKVDPQSLKKCLVNQPLNRHKWHVEWAEANKEKRKAKNRLEIEKSKLASEARNKWDVLGFSKRPTDQMVKDWIPQQERCIDAEIEYIDWIYKSEVLSGVKSDFDDRRASLNDLVKLYLASYYADESIVGKEARDLLQEMDTDEHIDHINKTDQIKKLKRRKKGA